MNVNINNINLNNLAMRKDLWPLNVTLEATAVLLLLIPPFFRIFLPQASATTLGMTIVALLLLFAASTRPSAKAEVYRGISSVPVILLCVFFILLLINSNIDLAAGTKMLWIIQFGGSLVAVCMLLTCSTGNWMGVAIRAIGVFGLFYSAATILFMLIPESYSAVYPYLQAKSVSPITGMGYRAGLTVHYSTNGIYTALGFLACSAMALSRKGKSWTLCACVCLLALILTTKRAHLAFGVAAFSAAYFAFNSQRKLGSFGRFILVATIALITLYVVSFFNDEVLAVIGRFQELADDDSLNGRSEFYDLCLSMWERSPLIGNGWGSYTLEFNNTAEGMFYISRGYSTMNAHNVYLQVLAEEGVIGFSLFIGAVAMGIICALRALMYLVATNDAGKANMREKKALLAGALSIQVFFAMYCLTGNPLYDAQMYVPWLLALGVSSVLSQGAFKKRGARTPLQQNTLEASSR